MEDAAGREGGAASEIARMALGRWSDVDAQVDFDALPLQSRTRVRWPVAPGMLGDPVADIVAPVAGLVAARRRANALHPGDAAFTLFVPV